MSNKCSECGRPAENLFPIRRLRICVNCLPHYLERLRLQVSDGLEFIRREVRAVMDRRGIQ